MHFALDESQHPLQKSRQLYVRGRNFVPLTNEMFCRVAFSDTEETVISARYINNHTLSCDLPAPPSTIPLPIAAPIEVSFNQGQQYTTSKVRFYFTP